MQLELALSRADSEVVGDFNPIHPPPPFPRWVVHVLLLLGIHNMLCTYALWMGLLVQDTQNG